MIKNYILSAWRNIRRQKTNSVIHIVGLSVGLGIFILIAWPIGYYLMDQWLMSFAYQTHIPWTLFGAALILSLTIAIATVVFQSVKAANTNPARVLRDE